MFNNSGSSVIRITNRCLMKVGVFFVRRVLLFLQTGFHFSCGLQTYVQKRVACVFMQMGPLCSEKHFVFHADYTPACNSKAC